MGDPTLYAPGALRQNQKNSQKKIQEPKTKIKIKKLQNKTIQSAPQPEFSSNFSIGRSRRSHVMEDIDLKCDPIVTTNKPELIRANSYSELDNIKRDEEVQKRVTEQSEIDLALNQRISQRKSTFFESQHFGGRGGNEAQVRDSKQMRYLGSGEVKCCKQQVD